MMKIIRSFTELAAGEPNYLVLTVGNFDGLHLGHQRIIGAVIKAAKERQGTPAVMTFDPHPLRVIAPEIAPKQIQTLDQKLATLEKLGVAMTMVVPFTPELARSSARQFAAEILGRRLAVKEIYVGANFVFGHNREGNVELLEQIGRECGFKVACVPEVRFRGLRVSSTLVRDLLVQGRVSLAHRLLNRFYTISGTVVSGRRVGGQLGFPTANLKPENEIVPRFGVYVTYFIVDGQRYRSVTNIGVRPTFDEDARAPTIETYILDFTGDLYARKADIKFCFRLRDEKRFASKEELAAQINRDIAHARRYFDFLERNLVSAEVRSWR